MFGLRQIVSVFLLAALPAQAGPVSFSDAVEFPEETAAIVAATVALFEAAEARDAKPAVPSIQLGLIATPASAETATPVDAFAERGPVAHLTGYRISWYPVDRFLGSVDFMGTWDGNRNLVCGYVTWDLSDPKAPALDQIAVNYVDLDTLADATPDAVQIALLDANCAYGDVEMNYRVFDPA